MSTITATPGTATPVVDLPAAGRRIGGLLRAFWYRSKNIAAPVFRVTSGLVPYVVTPVMMFASPPVVDLASAALLATDWGRRGLGTGFTLLGRGLNWLVRKAVQGVHLALDWVGYRIGDVVGLVSEKAAVHVYEANKSFTDTREVVGGWVRQQIAGVIDRIMAGADTPLVHGVVGFTAALIGMTIGVSMLAPSTFLGVVATTPIWLQPHLLNAAAGGIVNTLTVFGAFAISTCVSMLAQAFRRDEDLSEAVAAAESTTVAKKVQTRRTVTATVPEEPVLTDEQRAEQIADGESAFRHGPGKRGNPQARDYPAKAGKGGHKGRS